MKIPMSVFIFGFYSKVPQPIISIRISKLGSIHNEDKLSFHCVILYYKELLGSGEETSSPIKSVTFNPVYSGSIECTTDQLTDCL